MLVSVTEAEIEGLSKKKKNVIEPIDQPGEMNNIIIEYGINRLNFVDFNLKNKSYKYNI